MRHDPIEIGLARKMKTRRSAKRWIRSAISARRLRTEASTPATDAIDEAFAGLVRGGPHISRVDVPKRDQASAGGEGVGRPKKLSVVSQLAEQLAALDRQREQLAQLLREIEVATMAD